ncbi:MAG: DNA polymerase III subunit gamma/tau [Clostridia bacterium]
MAYTALYRKFRPLNFSQIVGQEHITRTLKNQIIAGRLGHAYLFNGGRGTGKTSAAKILARAVNCLNPKEGEPCNECEICKASLAGTLTDIVEMDAASNNSVEDIRQIRDEVNFLPTAAKYRVYIIDEVHMLSTGAFNALLKTLEEPPAHVKFILATTEPQKLPATILSRCQRFDFKKISNEDIAKRLQYVCDESKIEITKEALKVISTLAEGAMRDALSILERCLQDGETKIDEDKVKELVGIPKLTYVHQIIESIIDKQVEAVLQGIDTVIKDGKDLQNLLWEMIKYVKDILVYQTSHQLDLYSQEEIEKIEKLSKKVTNQELLNLLYALSTIENEIKWSTQKWILFQVGMIKLCNGQNTQNHTENTQIEQLTQKVEKLQQQINQLSQGVIHKEVKNVDNDTSRIPAPPISQKRVEEPIQNTSKTQSHIKEGDTLNNWPKIVGDLKTAGKIMLYTNLMNTTAKQMNDMTIGIIFPNGLTSFGKTILEKSENVAELEKRISMECGKAMRVQYIDSKTQKTNQVPEVNPIESLAQDLDIPFQVIE